MAQKCTFICKEGKQKRDGESKRWGEHFSAVHYLCTEGTLTKVRERYTVSACKHHFTQHIHTHSHLRAYRKPCCKGKMAAGWILCFWIWFIVEPTDRCFRQSVLGLFGSLGVALHTQDFAIQRVAAIFIRLYGERASTILQSKFKRWPHTQFLGVHLMSWEARFETVSCLTNALPHNGNTWGGSSCPGPPLGLSPHCPQLEQWAHCSSHTEVRNAWKREVEGRQIGCFWGLSTSDSEERFHFESRGHGGEKSEEGVLVMVSSLVHLFELWQYLPHAHHHTYQ